MRSRLDLHLRADLVLHDARHDAGEAIARRPADDDVGLALVGRLDRELRERGAVDEPAPTLRARRRDATVVDPTAHGVDAHPEQLSGLSYPIRRHVIPPGTRTRGR